MTNPCRICGQPTERFTSRCPACIAKMDKKGK